MEQKNLFMWSDSDNIHLFFSQNTVVSVTIQSAHTLHTLYNT